MSSSTSTRVIFIPGYITSNNWDIPYTTYHDVKNCLSRAGFDDIHYISLSNNNMGDLGNTTISDLVTEAVCKYQHLERSHENVRMILMGHSMGGLIAYQMLHHITPDIVMLLNPCFQPTVSVLYRILITFVVPFIEQVDIPIRYIDENVLYDGSSSSSKIHKHRLSRSVYSGTGSLLPGFNHRLTDPPVDITKDIVHVLHSMGDKVVSVHGTIARHDVMKNVCILESPYHEPFTHPDLLKWIKKTLH